MAKFARYVLWGSAGHAKVLSSLIELSGGHVIALFDNKDVEAALPGVPVYKGVSGFRRWATEANDLHSIQGLVAIGGRNGRDRLAIQVLFVEGGLSIPIVVHPHASVCPTAWLGAGTQILAQSIIAADCHVGAACIVNHKASVDHECTLGAGVHVGPGATLCGCVTVGDGSFIGAGATVLPRISIGSDAVVGAGAVVTRDVASGTTVVGNPARTF